MSNQPVRTQLETADGWLDFQAYFVRERAAPVVRALRYVGAADARATLSWPDASHGLAAFVICPSNPYLSIDPILAVPPWRRRLQQRQAPVIAVSPIVAGDALKGCAAKLLREFDRAVNPVTIAYHYGICRADREAGDCGTRRPDRHA